MSEISKSPFIQQLIHETDRIKDIIKKPKLVESKFKTLLGLHEGLETMINEYVRTSSDEIRIEVEDILKKWCSKFRTEWKDDLNKLDELNQNVLKYKGNSQQNEGGNEGNGGKCKNIHIASWRDIVNKITENVNVEVEVFDESIYGELNEYVDVNLKKDDLNRPEVKEMIKQYNELREEIEDGLDEIVEDVKKIEKRWMKVREKLEDKGKKCLNEMYVCHLNYLKAVISKKECDLKVNGRSIEGKQTEWLKGWLEY